MDWETILLRNSNKPTIIWVIKDGKLYQHQINDIFKADIVNSVKNMSIKKIFKSISNTDIKNYIDNDNGKHNIDKYVGTFERVNDIYIYETFEIMLDIDSIQCSGLVVKNGIIKQCNPKFYKLTRYDDTIINKPINTIFKNPLKDICKQTNWLIKKNTDIVLVNIYKKDNIITIKKLKYNLDLYKHLFQKIPNPIIIFENKDNKYLYSASNELFTKMQTIWKLPEVNDKSISEIFGENILYKINNSSNEKIEKVELQKRIYDFVIIKQDIYIVLIIVDITDKTIIDEINNLRVNFFDNVNHEIKTSINCILSTVNLIMDTILTVEQKEYINIISDCNTSIINIMNDIIDYTNIKMGTFELTENVFNLRNELKHIIDDTRQKLKDTSIEFRVNIDDNIPQYLKGDINRINQIIYSFLSNAIKFTENGKIVFDIYKVNNTSPKKDCNKIVFCVKDTGNGIPENKQNDIFTLFYQLEHKSKYRGIGLGLTLCKELCEMMGGKIWFESKVNVGSAFYFCVSLPESNELERIIELSTELFKDKKIYIDNMSESSVEQWELIEFLSEIKFNIVYSNEEADLCIKDTKLITRDDIEYIITYPLNKTELIKTLSNIFSPLKGSKFEYKVSNDLAILLSENSSRTQQNIINILNKNGYFNIDVASNAEETLNKIFSNKEYDLHLIDLRLSNMNGYEIAKIINAKLVKKPYIVALVDSKNKNIEKEYKKYGIDAYIFKPVDETVVKSLLKIVNKYRN